MLLHSSIQDKKRAKMAATFYRRGFLRYKNNLFIPQVRTGFVVTIPEEPEGQQNEVFAQTGHLVDFDKVTTKDCRDLLTRRAQMYDFGAWQLSEDVRAMMEKNQEVDLMKHVLGPLELMYVPFFSTWGLVQTLYYANSDIMPAKVYGALNRRASKVRFEKFNLKPIYQACKDCLEKESDKLTTEQKRVLQKLIWEGQTKLVHATQDEWQKYHFILQEWQMRTRDYMHKWTNAVFNFRHLIVDEKILDEFPPDLLRYTAMNPEEPTQGPWFLTLKPRVAQRFLEYCETRQSRLFIWLNQRQICSKHGDARYRAESEVERIRDRKADYAKLLGYPTYAHFSIQTKMAQSLVNVHDMLDALLEKAKIGHEMDLNELDSFAQSRTFVGQIEMWDFDYWARLHKKEMFHFDEIALQDYFPLGQVMLGLFALCEQLFGIVIEEEKNVIAWHTDVRYFNVRDERTKQDLGGFYFDPFTRKSKQMSEEEGGVFISLSIGSKVCNTLPSCSLIFDFAPPTADKPSLLLFREVEDLFLKFGFALQHILSNTCHAEVSGFSYLENDAIPIGAKFLRHWLYEKGTLESVSGHYNTGEPLPSEVVQGIGKMKHHMAGTNLCRDIYLSHLDLQLHIDTECCMPIVQRLWPKHFLFQLLDQDHHPFGMKEVIMGHMACSCYSKVWSDLVAADAFKAFEEVGLRNQEEVSRLGQRFRTTYLATAGSDHPSEVFRQFRGRDPSPTPYLDSLGLANLTPISPSTEPEPEVIAAN